MTHPGERAVEVWRGLFAAYVADQAVPEGSPTASEVAEVDDVLELVLHAALVFDELLNVGSVPVERLVQSMANLLVGRDYLRPLPGDPGPLLRADFEESVAAVRAGREVIRGQG